MSNRKELHIIVPSFNRKDNLLELIDQLNQQLESCDTIRATIIAVIDGSTDGTLEALETDNPEVVIVKGDGNWWYTRSMNEGFTKSRELKPDYILTLNDDIVLANNYMEHIEQLMLDNNKPAVIGSLSLTMGEPHRVLYGGIKKWIKWRKKFVKYFKYFEIADPSRLKGIHPSVVLPGRGMLFPMEILKQTKGFDNRFIQYQSDTDFCLRAARKGYDILISYDLVIYSYIDKTASVSSHIQVSFKDFVKSFFDPYSRLHFGQRSLFYWRHINKLFWPLVMFLFVLTSYQAQFFKKKIAS